MIPTRPLGRTGHSVTLFALGGEGVLRTHGQAAEAAAVIERALDCGVNYCDTAPAYSSSMDYYGAVLGERREEIFLASKTADRTRDGSLRILDDSLRRLRTDRLDLWQLHDLRSMDELDSIFSKDGAIHAFVRARDEQRVRFLGITGHHDPAVLVEAMRRFDFDTVLVALNTADVHRRVLHPDGSAGSPPEKHGGDRYEGVRGGRARRAPRALFTRRRHGVRSLARRGELRGRRLPHSQRSRGECRGGAPVPEFL